MSQRQFGSTEKSTTGESKLRARSGAFRAGRKLTVKCSNSFIWISAVVLCLTAAAKLVAVSQEQQILAAPDPLFSFWTVREVLVVAAVVELTVGLVLVSRRAGIPFKLQSVLWLALVFLAYHTALSALGFHGYCSCLGKWTDWMHLSQDQANTAVRAVLFWFLGGSSVLLLTHRWLLGRFSEQ